MEELVKALYAHVEALDRYTIAMSLNAQATTELLATLTAALTEGDTDEEAEPATDMEGNPIRAD